MHSKQICEKLCLCVFMLNFEILKTNKFTGKVVTQDLDLVSRFERILSCTVHLKLKSS